MKTTTQIITKNLPKKEKSLLTLSKINLLNTLYPEYTKAKKTVFKPVIKINMRKKKYVYGTIVKITTNAVYVYLGLKKLGKCNISAFNQFLIKSNPLFVGKMLPFTIQLLYLKQINEEYYYVLPKYR